MNANDLIIDEPAAKAALKKAKNIYDFCFAKITPEEIMVVEAGEKNGN